MSMRARHLIAGAALVLSAGFVSEGAQARDLTVVSWGGSYQDAQKEVYFQPFVEATGTPLIDESWDGGIGVLRAKVEGGNSTWDVVQVESEELALGCDEGLFEPLDFDRLGGADAYIPSAVSECGVGAIVYNFVLGYDKDALAKAPTSWADFFDTETWPGKRALRGGPKTTLEIALMADGVAPAEVYDVLATEEGVDRAFAKLDTIKDDLVFWKAGAQPPQFLAAGEVVMTSIYNGRVDAANKGDGRNFGIVWDGSLYTLDSWVILSGTPNLDQSYDFLAFVGQPEVQAGLPQAIAYGVSAKGVNDLIPADRLADLPTADANMANAVLIDTAFWLEHIEQLTTRFNKWAAVQ